MKLILTRKDLESRNKDVPINEILFLHFLHLPYQMIKLCDTIVFVDDDGTNRFLKSPYLTESERAGVSKGITFIVERIYQACRKH